MIIQMILESDLVADKHILITGANGGIGFKYDSFCWK